MKVTNKKMSDLKPITDPVKARNTKCKRTKNLVKKCLELSQLCELSINISMYDAKRHKLQEICTNRNFTLEKVFELIDNDRNCSDRNLKKLKMRTRLASDIANEVNEEE